MGADLARRTEVVALEAGTLRIRVPDARWRKVLHRMQREILGAAARVGRRLRPVPARLRRRHRSARRLGAAATRRRPPARALAAAVSGRGLADRVPPAIADPELRERFLFHRRPYLSRATFLEDDRHA